MPTEADLKHLSKFLSLLLRHKPELIGLHLDENGWADVDMLLTKINGSGKALDLPTLQMLVAINAKKRFAFDETGSKIRASQGHSVTIDLGIAPQQPPEILYHGTAAQNRDAILAEGLKKGNRRHVHLSIEKDTAMQVGSRHGRPLIFNVLSGRMHADGYAFYLSENGVWLTDNVPAKYVAL